jgi:hypothetical protein
MLIIDARFLPTADLERSKDRVERTQIAAECPISLLMSSACRPLACAFNHDRR